MQDRRRWFLVGLAVLTLVAIADIYFNGAGHFLDFADGFSVIQGGPQYLK